MEALLAFLGSAGLIYALGREHGARKARRSMSRKKGDWSPYDGFWSDRR